MKPRPSDTRLVIQPCRGCSARFTQSNKGPRLSSRDPPPSPPSLARTVGFHARVFQLSHVSLAAPPHVIPVAAGIQSPSPRHSRRSGNPEPLPPVILAAAGIQSPSPRHSRRSGNPEPLPPVILAAAGIQSPSLPSFSPQRESRAQPPSFSPQRESRALCLDELAHANGPTRGDVPLSPVVPVAARIRIP